MAGDHALPVERARRCRSDVWADFWKPTVPIPRHQSSTHERALVPITESRRRSVGKVAVHDWRRVDHHQGVQIETVSRAWVPLIRDE